MGAEGKSNTLLGMTLEIISRLKSLEAENLMLKKSNRQLVFQEQQQRSISNALRAELAKLKD